MSSTQGCSKKPRKANAEKLSKINIRSNFIKFHYLAPDADKDGWDCAH